MSETPIYEIPVKIPTPDSKSVTQVSCNRDMLMFLASLPLFWPFFVHHLMPERVPNTSLHHCNAISSLFWLMKQRQQQSL